MEAGYIPAPGIPALWAISRVRQRCKMTQLWQKTEVQRVLISLVLCQTYICEYLFQLPNHSFTKKKKKEKKGNCAGGSFEKVSSL